MDKIIVVGGGISGFISAINAKNDNNEVIILERNDKVLKKLLLTGNGKCNYFNDDFSINHYYSDDFDLLKNHINLENKNKVLEFFDELGIVPRIKNGYYYPYSNQAITIKNALLKKADVLGIKIKTNSFVKNIENKNNNFYIKVDNEIITSDKLIISTGSKSYPSTGSDGSGYDLLKKLGHSVNKVLPSLTGLICEEKYFKDLNGVRIESEVSLYEDDKLLKSETGELQFTNYGVSGICIFNLSNLVSKGLEKGKNEMIYINFLKGLNISEKEDLLRFLENRNSITSYLSISELLDNLLNYKLTNLILKKCKISNNKLYSELSSKEKDVLCECLLKFKIKVVGTNDFTNAQTCSGGIPLKEVNENFESKLIPNLYLTGEVIDVSGDCGGYNIGFAALSGIIAGISCGGSDD